MKFQTTLRLTGAELARFKARMAGLLATRVGGPVKMAEAKAKTDTAGSGD